MEKEKKEKFPQELKVKAKTKEEIERMIQHIRAMNNFNCNHQK